MKPPRLRRGGDGHVLLRVLVEGGGVGDNLVDPDQVAHKISPSIRKITLARLIKHGWVMGNGRVAVTDAGLKQLELV